MTNRFVVYSSMVAVLLLAWVAAHYYSTELSALLWHMRHGSRAEVNGIQLPVPPAYEASASPGLPTLLMVRQAGHLWRGGGIIDIDFHKQPSPQSIRLLESKGILKRTIVAEQVATFAGRPGKCIEEIPQTEDARLQELMRQRDLLAIDCWFGGEVEVTFRGTANLRNEFYSVVRGAAPVQGKP